MASTTHAKCQPSQRIVNTRCQLLHTVICGDCANFKTVGKTVSAPLCRRHCFYPGLNALADTTVVPPDGGQTPRSSISRTMDVVAAMPLQRFHEVVVKHKRQAVFAKPGAIGGATVCDIHSHHSVR